jgi:hypothetical protein
MQAALVMAIGPSLKALVERLEPAEGSAMFPHLGKSQRALLFRTLPRSLADDVFSFLDEDR